MKLSELVHRPDFKIGPLEVSPSRRIVRGPQGEQHLEPLIMLVFLLLIDAQGKVVTRNDLFDHAWGGAMVGDDSLNRAIAKVRRIGSELAPGLFEIETIPRTGYRLVGAIFGHVDDDGLPEPPTFASRRMVVGGSMASVAVAAAGTWWWQAQKPNKEVAELLAEGQQHLSGGWPDSDMRALAVFRRAAAIEPANAGTWGLIALAHRNVAEQAPPSQISQAVMDCETAARRALGLDPAESNALTALATVRPEFGNWGETEGKLRAIVSEDPENTAALSYLVMILQSVGRAQESWRLNERCIELEPFSPIHQFRRGLKLWIFGRTDEADLAIDRSLQLFPRHPAVWNARMYIFAYTGRASAALKMLSDTGTRPVNYTEASGQLWESSLKALDSGSAQDVKAAVEANIHAAPKSPGFAVRAIMTLAALGQIDAAYAVTEGFLLRKGPLVGTLWRDKDEPGVYDHYWRRTMNLFTPATAGMRSDSRFAGLCDGIGLTRYWREKGLGPDPMFRIG